jgi:hypothetical protein
MSLDKRTARISVLTLGAIFAACSAPHMEEEEEGTTTQYATGGVRCDGCSVRPHVQSFASALCRDTGSCDSGSYNGHQPTAALAIDNFVPVSSALGDRVADWALANRGRFGAEYVIWKQRINFGSGWRWMEDRGSITQNHYDHVHISFFPNGGVEGMTCPGGRGTVLGKIEEKYRSIGGCGSILGAPVSEELGTPDTRGRYTVFEKGSIYWTAELGAHEVHGVIRDKWKELGWEPGVLGYPITDEITTPDEQGRYNVFERGSVYWTAELGAHEVLGVIRDKWKELGWEEGALGYPTSGEYDVPEGRRSDFERGSITWSRATNTATATLTNANGDSDAGPNE